MRLEPRSLHFLSITRSKAKMYEFAVPREHHIQVASDPVSLLSLCVGILGDFAAQAARADGPVLPSHDQQAQLLQAARYFDAYRKGRFRGELDHYLLLLASSAYYLCDMPGSSSVLADDLPRTALSLEARGLDQLLLHVLRERELGQMRPVVAGPFSALVSEVVESLDRYYASGGQEEQVLRPSRELRRRAYDEGSPRELLLADAIAAVVRRRYDNSTRRCLPLLTGEPEESWGATFAKPGFMRELWPSQRLLGEHAVFSGASAVIQMPTSAGKTRATELVIRSAFLSGRTNLAVIVAPFRALCHEISGTLEEKFRGEAIKVNELSDAFDLDFDGEEFLALQGVLVLTPEKLMFLLRHVPELAGRIGLVIYDEGHQFDSGKRGVTFELLITSLRLLIPKSAQSLLISAVISNAADIGEWLNGDANELVDGTSLFPTERSLAFASWTDSRGQLQFMDRGSAGEPDYFVPRVLEQHELRLRPRETAKRVFPKRDEGHSIACYLGVKVVAQGAVALFCGTKASVPAICRDLVDAFDRGLSLPVPLQFSDAAECARLAALTAEHLGADAWVAQAAKLGVFAHHGNTPHGLRVAVEYAMQKGLARFVICTSTLAQGVNLPIRYLVVGSVSQGRANIKTRDFQNLLGRAGRSGKHIEGSILIADPKIFDGRTATRDRWRWAQMQSLLRPEESEPCASAILEVLNPLASDNGKDWTAVSPLDLVTSYVGFGGGVRAWARAEAAQYVREGFSLKDLEKQLVARGYIFASVESFLLAHMDVLEAGDGADVLEALFEATLAYHLAGELARPLLRQIFTTLERHVRAKAPTEASRAFLSRTLFGVTEALQLEAWVRTNAAELENAVADDALVEVLMPAICERIGNNAWLEMRPPKVQPALVWAWLGGAPYAELLQILIKAKVRFGTGKHARRPTAEYAVELGENALGYEAAMIVSAVVACCEAVMPNNPQLTERLRRLHRRMRYGLSTDTELGLFELGFVDRVVARRLAELMPIDDARVNIRESLRVSAPAARTLLDSYPSYFMRLLDRLIS